MRAQRQFGRWVAAHTYLNWTGPWFRAYHYLRAGLPTEWAVTPLRTEGGIHGIVLFYDARIGPDNFGHLFRLLRDRVLALGYRVAQADERLWTGTSRGETLAKYLLHPLPATCPRTQHCDQRFGQVALELVSQGRQPSYLRLVATPLPESGVFTEARSFDDLLAQVLGVDDTPEPRARPAV